MQVLLPDANHGATLTGMAVYPAAIAKGDTARWEEKRFLLPSGSG